MTLLAPLAGLLAGVLGLAALIALHALKLRRRPVRVSSTLLWKDATRDLEVNTPLRRPRLTWLLLLQALAVLLLALAIARPVVGGAPGTSSSVIIVIDASASMNATNTQGQSAFDRAIDEASDRLDALRRSDTSPEVAVVRFAGDATLVLAPTRSIPAARDALDRMAPTDQPGDAAALLTLLDSLGRANATDDDAPPAPDLWVFTDGGSVDASALAGRTGEVVSVATDSPAPNAGIAALHASRDPEDPGRARVFVRLVSNADRPAGIVLAIESPDESARVPIEIPARTGDAIGSVTRTIPVRSAGASTVSVTIEQGGGSLTADDTAWVALPDPAPPRTVVFAPDGRADSFLLNVLSELAPGAVSVHSTTETDALVGAALIVYDRVTPAAVPEAPSLGFGSAWPGASLPDRTGRERVIAWERAHPALRGVSLSSVVFDRAVGLPGAGTPGVRVLAESDAGPVITETTGAGVRHLRVAFPLIRSNWSLEVGMPIFLARAFERLAPGTRGEGTAHRTSDRLNLRATADRVEATGPAGTVSATPGPDGSATLGPLERVGIYRLTGAQTTQVAVSLLDAAESALPTSPGATLGTSRARAQAGDTGGRRELWPTLLLAAVVVMTLEYLLHAARARV